MKRYIRIFILLLIVSTSCRDEDSRLGYKFVESSFTNVIVDSCTVKMSTILLDSIYTSGDTICQLGQYYDPLVGRISTSCYAEYDVPTFIPNGNYEYTYDSLMLQLYYTGDYLGDTLSTIKINVYKLLEDIYMHSDGALYNTSDMKKEEEPFFSFSFVPSPNDTLGVEIRLPDELGEEFFELLMERSPYVQTQTNFRGYFPGLAFIPDHQTGNCIAGFRASGTSLTLTMHYQVVGSSGSEAELTFTPSSSYIFNKVNYDHAGTPLADLHPGAENALSSLYTSNMAFTQGMTGLYTKIEFPFLNDLAGEGELVAIEQAILYLYPVQDFENEFRPLPSSLALYTVNQGNVVDDQVMNSSGDQVQDGNLSVDQHNGYKTCYTFDITNFIQGNFQAYKNDTKFLYLTLPDDDFLTTCSTVLFGDMDHPNHPVKFQVYYKTYSR